MNWIEKAEELRADGWDFFIATIDDNLSYPVEFGYDSSAKWIAGLGDGIDGYGPTMESAVEVVYELAKNHQKPCKTCLAQTRYDEPLNDEECLNCYNTRTQKKVFFSVGLERTTEQLERTAHIL